MESDGPSPKERKMVLDQIMITTKITVGVTLLAVGISIHLTSIFYMNENRILFFGLAGAFIAYATIGGILLRSGVKQAKKDYGDPTKETPARKH